MTIPIPKYLMLELSSCHKNCNKGIIIQPSLRNYSQWQIYFFPSSGVFKSCILTCLIEFRNYPQEVPIVIFQSGLFHPYVDHSTFRYDTTPFFKEWNLQNRISSLLNAIYDSFIDIPLPQMPCVNPEAAKLLRQDKNIYEKRALEELPAIEDPSQAQNAINKPKRWNDRNEELLNCFYNHKIEK